MASRADRTNSSCSERERSPRISRGRKPEISESAESRSTESQRKTRGAPLSRRPGPTPQLCKVTLHELPGTTTSHCSKSCARAMSVCGMRARLHDTVGRSPRSFYRSIVALESAKARHKRISQRHCLRRMALSPNRSSRTHMCSISWAPQIYDVNVRSSRRWWITCRNFCWSLGPVLRS